MAVDSTSSLLKRGEKLVHPTGDQGSPALMNSERGVTGEQSACIFCNTAMQTPKEKVIHRVKVTTDLTAQAKGNY